MYDAAPHTKPPRHTQNLKRVSLPFSVTHSAKEKCRQFGWWVLHQRQQPVAEDRVLVALGVHIGQSNFSALRWDAKPLLQSPPRHSRTPQRRHRNQVCVSFVWLSYWTLLLFFCGWGKYLSKCRSLKIIFMVSPLLFLFHSGNSWSTESLGTSKMNWRIFWYYRWLKTYIFSSVITFHASVGQNPYLCESGQCNFEKKQKNIATPIVASISGVLILLVAVAILWTLKRRKSKGNAAILKYSYFLSMIFQTNSFLTY